MSDDRKTTVPVWTLATADVRAPVLPAGESMTAERLAELRGVLAALADEPIVTLEVHPLPDKIDRSRGIPLDAASPLATHLSQFITQASRSSLTTARATGSGEILCRVVVPAKVATQLGKGLVRPLVPKAGGGFYGDFVDAAGKFAGKATFVPVGGTAAVGAAGAAGGAGATAGIAVGGSAALTVAAPLVLMAVAVGVSAHADRKREQAIEHITELLEELKQDKLDDELSELNGCRAAIDKATAILLDEGKLGVSLGLDSAVHALDKALGKAGIRLGRWQAALDALPEGKAVELATLTKPFPGIDDDGGVFRTHLELASLAIALMRRVVVLQAVERAQAEPGNPFQHFTRALQRDQQRIDELEAGITGVLVRLSALELTRPSGLRPVLTVAEVERLMRAAHRLHRLGDGVTADGRATDVAIEMARDKDGSVVVFPALAA
ncbi:hypothetical protein [Streptomyces sp. L2]|uniref:hypothetical protein n=1 Tax=Streptomyces sp. L2 TaxID=2162665 RepID=UPI0010125FC4|nr:hypothetical protein [Streptomyces sp. L2]